MPFGLRLPGGAPDGPIVGLLQKDWRTLVRDPRWRTGARWNAGFKLRHVPGL